jgi:selenocysteine lyase/cysteine desulfurase
MAPQLKAVAAAGNFALQVRQDPRKWRQTDFFEPVREARRLFAALVNGDPERVALLPSVSYGLATVARNLPLRAGQEIIVVKDQFPSNYYCWERLARERNASLKVVASPATGKAKTTAWNEALLAAIDERTALVAIANVHWADGTWFDLAALRRKTREVGAWLVVDGTQSVGALPLDMAALELDALIVAGYKLLMGPYATAYGYFGPVFDDGIPIEENWINRRDSDDFRNLVNYQSEYGPGAARYSVGQQSNFQLLPMQVAALQQVLAFGAANIQEYTRDLLAPYLEEFRALGIDPPEPRAHHLVGLPLPAGIDLPQLNEILREHDVMVSVRGDTLRLSLNVYNEPWEIERVLAALRAANRLAATGAVQKGIANG